MTHSSLTCVYWMQVHLARTATGSSPSISNFSDLLSSLGVDWLSAPPVEMHPLDLSPYLSTSHVYRPSDTVFLALLVKKQTKTKNFVTTHTVLLGPLSEAHGFSVTAVSGKRLRTNRRLASSTVSVQNTIPVFAGTSWFPLFCIFGLYFFT